MEGGESNGHTDLSGNGKPFNLFELSKTGIKLVSGEEVRRQDQEQQQAALQQSTPDYSRMTDFAAQDRRAKAADLENISLTFNKTDSFDYLGSESGLENLDVMKAVSDMRKDEVLQEYQYFVGSFTEFCLPVRRWCCDSQVLREGNTFRIRKKNHTPCAM